MAEIGRKVLLVDSDLRRPRLHSKYLACDSSSEEVSDRRKSLSTSSTSPISAMAILRLPSDVVLPSARGRTRENRPRGWSPFRLAIENTEVMMARTHSASRDACASSFQLRMLPAEVPLGVRENDLLETAPSQTVRGSARL